MIRDDLAIIIPAYNEESSIGAILESLYKHWNVFVIDDKSIDNTAKIIKKYNVNLIRNKLNFGYSRSIQKGILKVKQNGFRYAITFDCDGEHKAEDLPNFLKLLEKGNSMVLGSRNKKNRFLEKLVAIFMNIFFKIEDPFCGLKGYDLTQIELDNNYLRIPMEDVNTYLMINFLKKGLKYCNCKINTGIRSNDINSRFGTALFGEMKLLKSLRYWI